jgi:hypothetical protein
LWFLIFRANLLFFLDTAKHFALFLLEYVKMGGEERAYPATAQIDICNRAKKKHRAERLNKSVNYYQIV